MKRKFLTLFLNKISDFPSWAKEIVYNHLAAEVVVDSSVSVFASYKPILTYKGRCELDFKKSGFDSNMYNILSLSDGDYSLSEISLNTFLSMEEVARYFLFFVDEGYFELPDNSQILNIAGFLSGKYRTGEYFVKSGNISEKQLDEIVTQKENDNSEKKFGQYLVDCGFISKCQLDTIIKLKQEATMRFVLDYNDVPEMKQVNFANSNDDYQQEILELQNENKQLKTKLNQLLVMTKKTRD